jgi:hypothetical protein
MSDCTCWVKDMRPMEWFGVSDTKNPHDKSCPKYNKSWKSGNRLAFEARMGWLKERNG